ncbi:MAG: peptidoglycan editing factor PgeF [Wenzhouxiangella sp.]
MLPLVRPDWSLPGVQALSTLRQGGVSIGPWASLNLGAACGDDPGAVAANRARIQALLPTPPRWLKQVHGTRAIHLDEWEVDVEADAAWTDQPGAVVAILTADCMPVLLADRQARVVAAAHAGWRGLCDGVLPRLISVLPVAPADLRAWIGPAIGPAVFEVGPEVRAAFLARDPGSAPHFLRGRDDRWLADLKSMAAQQLQRLGVGAVTDCGLCTYADPERFFSYRRDRICGRMASLIWLE